MIADVVTEAVLGHAGVEARHRDLEQTTCTGRMFFEGFQPRGGPVVWEGSHGRDGRLLDRFATCEDCDAIVAIPTAAGIEKRSGLTQAPETSPSWPA